MNEVKQIKKERAKRVITRNSRWVEVGVAGLLLAEVVRFAEHYGAIEWLLSLI